MRQDDVPIFAQALHRSKGGFVGNLDLGLIISNVRIGQGYFRDRILCSAWNALRSSPIFTILPEAAR